MIAKITKAYIRHYSDNGQTTAYVEWIDHNGKPGRTEGNIRKHSGTLSECYGDHMGALFARAICHGINVERQTW